MTIDDLNELPTSDIESPASNVQKRKFSDKKYSNRAN